MESVNRGRKSNWTGEEEVMLVEEVSNSESLLFGRHDGASRTQQTKSKVWQDIANRLNARNTSLQRKVPEIKKKYQNIKQKAKEKRSGLLHPKTGGGKKPASPTVPERLVLQNLEGRPSLCGLSEGIDTAVPLSPGFINILPTYSGVDMDMPITYISPAASQATHTDGLTAPHTATSTCTSSKQKKDLSDEVLLEELARVKDARNLILERIELVKIQKHLAILQIKAIEPSFEE
ncbi:uncharacterized protein LOC117344502 [Pecten maximus]|uniref:uncharacterized protein LOC117317367 n=1 Tax=Pecten maximus TaxID=6579 RepID=UPI001458E902|nr:uncharacterized protein LOC117317367 [Pecten maximus]XP_033758776.1 uncharacterized protein LOC117341059 [Pecten maximus]XP_033760251.1 uncharacterized protein LOC117342270 [Pecten maximus]XP_033763154.1 uncharacterized protein LOC117344502 [Pecten maximus]